MGSPISKAKQNISSNDEERKVHNDGHHPSDINQTSSFNLENDGCSICIEKVASTDVRAEKQDEHNDINESNKRQIILDISSSSSSENDRGLTKSIRTNAVRERRTQKNNHPVIDISSSSSEQNISSTCNDSTDSDSVDDDDEVIYDWLQSNTSQFSHENMISNFTTPTKHQSPTALNTGSPKSKEQITFTPTGWDSPLNETSSLIATTDYNTNIYRRSKTNDETATVKDTNKVTRKHAQLPKEKPDVTKGNWLTNRFVVNNYIILHCIGKGSYGEVRLCKDKNSNNLFAVKIINRAKNPQSKATTISSSLDDDLKMEIAIMKKLHHENCVKLYEVMDDPRVNKLYLVLEYMSHGDLMQLITAGKKEMDDNDVWDIVRQVIRGLKYLHDNKIIHGDLKPQNLLVAFDGSIKIADFGLSKMIVGNEQQMESLGTPAFMAPEVCRGESFDGKVADLYSVGATTFYIRFSKPPFVGKNLTELYWRIQNNLVHFPFTVANGLEEIIKGLMEKNPANRLTMKQLIIFPWLQRRQDKCNERVTQLSSSYDKIQICNDDIYNSVKYIADTSSNIDDE